jgi:hypothetical protein
MIKVKFLFFNYEACYLLILTNLQFECFNFGTNGFIIDF